MMMMMMMMMMMIVLLFKSYGNLVWQRRRACHAVLATCRFVTLRTLVTPHTKCSILRDNI
jgi:hypothetical protein